VGGILNIVLYEPEIPQNTGVVGRLCVATGCVLHLIEPLGFRLSDRGLRRAGLDYWAKVDLHRYVNFDDFLKRAGPGRLLLFSTGGHRVYWEAEIVPGDYLVFGSETRGLPDELKRHYCERLFRIPMVPGGVRSLNLATAVGVVLYEGLRQLRAAGMELGLK